MLSDELYFERLALEVKLLQNEFPYFRPVGNDLTHWKGFLIGTGFYERGVFAFELHISRDFPFEPPKIVWRTRMWHPNFSDDEQTRICISILRNDWSPSLHITGVIHAIADLIDQPNPGDPLNFRAAKEMLSDTASFSATVESYIAKYATWKNLPWSV